MWPACTQKGTSATSTPSAARVTPLGNIQYSRTGNHSQRFVSDLACGGLNGAPCHEAVDSSELEKEDDREKPLPFFRIRNIAEKPAFSRKRRTAPPG